MTADLIVPPDHDFLDLAASLADKIGDAETLRIMPMTQIPSVVHEEQIRLGIVAVPAEAAQGVVDELTEAGIRGILNFAPVAVTADPCVSLISVDVAIELEQLSFLLRGGD